VHHRHRNRHHAHSHRHGKGGRACALAGRALVPVTCACAQDPTSAVQAQHCVTTRERVMTAQDTQLRFIEPVLLLIVRTGPGGCRWACGVAAAGGGIELAAYAAPCLQRSSEPTPTEVQPRLLVTMKAASDVSSAGIHFKPVLSSMTVSAGNFTPPETGKINSVAPGRHVPLRQRRGYRIGPFMGPVTALLA
jgi:hypothetical protein